MPQLPALAVNPPNFRGVMAQVAQQKFNEARLGALQAQGQRADRRLDFEIDQYATEQAQQQQVMGLRQQYAGGDRGKQMIATLSAMDTEWLGQEQERIRKMKADERAREMEQQEEYAQMAFYITKAETPEQKQQRWTEIYTELGMPEEMGPAVNKNWLARANTRIAGTVQMLKEADAQAPKQDTVDLPGDLQQQREWVNGEWVNVGAPVKRWQDKDEGQSAAPKLDWQYLPGGKMQRREWRKGEWHNVGKPVNRWQSKEGGSLTPAQKSNNAAIVRSRKEVRAALKKYRDDPAQLIAAAWGTDPIVRLGGGRDPILVGSIKKALSRRTGDDDDYEAFRELFLSVSPPPEPAAEPEDTDSGSIWDDWFSGIADMFGGDAPASAGGAAAPTELDPVSGSIVGADVARLSGYDTPAEVPFTTEGKIDVGRLEVDKVYRYRAEDGGVEIGVWTGDGFKSLGRKRRPSGRGRLTPGGAQ